MGSIHTATTVGEVREAVVASLQLSCHTCLYFAASTNKQTVKVLHVVTSHHSEHGKQSFIASRSTKTKIRIVFSFFLGGIFQEVIFFS